MTNFWNTLHTPFFVLAPMEDVTDTAFRELVMTLADPAILKVVFTEFTSVDGLLHPSGFEQVSSRLKVSASERKLLNHLDIKIIAQIWGSDPEKFHKAAQLITENYNFDGIDINMGCPVKKIIKNNCCSALINVPDLAAEIIQATKEGTSLPVSVKTRTGFKKHETERWIPQILSSAPAAITLHGRYQSMLSEGEANWDEIAKAVILRNEILPSCIMTGNGDIVTVEQGKEMSLKTGVEGIMVGRGIFKNANFFTSDTASSSPERIVWLKKHIDLFEEAWGNTRNPQILKRFFKIYIHSFDGAHQLREHLMKANTFDEFRKILDSFLPN